VAFLIVRYVHIASAITAVGLNVSYGIWLARASGSAPNTLFALKGIKFLDNRVANPAYGVLLVTGILMVILEPYPILTFWIDAALVLYAAIAVAGIVLYAPLVRRQVALAEQGDVSSETYRLVAGRGRAIGLALVALVAVILFLMVFKPAP
jgi:uncharacterized membrane protein